MNIKHYNGLTSEEVKNNQIKYGLNELKKVKRDNFFIIFIKEFNDWLVIILIIAALLGLIVDPNSLFETLVILSILFINASIGAYQEIKAHKTLDGLRKLSSHKVKVYRDKKIISIEPKFLTISDIVILEKGNIIDADMLILESNDLSMDESILTGESILIDKRKDDLVYSGTFAIRGNAVAKVMEVGMKSKIGQIANQIIMTEEENTPLEEKLSQIGKVIGLIAIIICAFVFLIELLLKIPLIEAFKSAVSLAVAAIPEGLATVVTVCLAIGVSKMAKENAIIKRLSSVETLGCSNIVCTDKTGTLTENKQKVLMVYTDKLYLKNEINNISKRILDYLYITSFLDEIDAIDPIDKGICNMLNDIKHPKPLYYTNNIKPFNSSVKYSKCNISYENCDLTLFKGAYDKLITIVKNKPNSQMLANFEMMLEKGYRVIALSDSDDILAIIGMQDLPRKDVIQTISMANNAGIKTIMITGDHAKTAFKIASELNITQDVNEVITKVELDKLSDIEFENKIEKYKVYARVDPIDKVRIVSTWQKKGMIVAMTGDGINDAPALKKADIGCAMGSGAEISKDCSDIILVDSNYNTIIKAVQNGRGIYENIKKCCKYLLSSNIGEVLTILIVTLLSLITRIDLGIPLLAIHMLWINVITDSLPAFGLGTMKSSVDLMKQKPRKKEDGFFDKDLTIDIIFMGIVIGLLTVISYFIGLKLNPLYASTMAFLTISTAQLLHSYNCASNRSVFSKQVLTNPLLNLSFVIGIILQFVVVYVNKVNSLFKLNPLPFSYLFISLLLSLIVVVISELKKKIKS